MRLVKYVALWVVLWLCVFALLGCTTTPERVLVPGPTQLLVCPEERPSLVCPTLPDTCQGERCGVEAKEAHTRCQAAVAAWEAAWQTCRQ